MEQATKNIKLQEDKIEEYRKNILKIIDEYDHDASVLNTVYLILAKTRIAKA